MVALGRASSGLGTEIFRRFADPSRLALRLLPYVTAFNLGQLGCALRSCSAAWLVHLEPYYSLFPQWRRRP